MKTKLITYLDRDILLVELPEDIEAYQYNSHYNQLFVTSVQKGTVRVDAKQIDKYSLLGKIDDISEEHAALFFNFDPYTVIIDGEFEHVTPIKLLHSAIECGIYWENPYEKPNGEDYYLKTKIGFDEQDFIWDAEAYYSDLRRFEISQQKTFDKSRSLVFVKAI